MFFLVPWPENTWSAAGRLAGRTSLPLTDDGRGEAEAWAEELAGHGIRVVYSSDDFTSTQTAKIIAGRCAARHRIHDTLREVDFGLWGGLTLEELKRRFPKIFKKWYDDPTSVCPPEGEDVHDAYSRLVESLGRIRQKQRHRNLAAVLGPLSLAVARCAIESANLSELRTMIHAGPLQYVAPDEDTELKMTLVARFGADPGMRENSGSTATDSDGSNHVAG